MKEKYCFKEIEKLAQKHWNKNHIFNVSENSKKEKYYCLSMLPYPSGYLHMGHVRNYTIGDVIARYQRMLGKNVLHPIGWDAFGLPAENAAIKKKILPSIWTYNNIKYMKRQLKTLGLSYDWSREITTCNPEYYKWEQWLFTILYKKGLAYKKTKIVNWCPNDKTVLANEQVIHGFCWRCNSSIKRKKISQWFLRIKKYAQELLEELDNLDGWPKKIIKMQKNWIGRSEGIEIDFQIKNSEKKITIYTTKPEFLMGVTYLTISVDHVLINSLKKISLELSNFILENSNIQVTESEISTIEKKGVNTNLFAIHPITKSYLPIWVSNFILEEHDKGAIMNVPGHEKDDLKFAKKYNLPIKIIIRPFNKKLSKYLPIVEPGILFNSGLFDGLSTLEARKYIIDYIKKNKIGRFKINYRLRDWGISRQRYWGTPIPIFYLKNNKIVPVPKKLLPIILSEKVNIKDIINFKKEKLFPIKYKFKNEFVSLETDTFDTFIESSWYYARYTCPHYKDAILDSHSANYWLPVDQYIGGDEHATLHLLYFRFFHKILRDYGLVKCNEPVKNLICQGMVLAEVFYFYDKNKRKNWISKEKIKIVRNKKGKFIKAFDKKNRKIFYDGMQKMSKSKNNGVDPEKIIKKYGADTVRLFIMFAAPIDSPLEWNENGIKGCYRFLNRLWNLVFHHMQNNKIISFSFDTFSKKQIELYEILNSTINLVSTCFEQNHFNVAIANIMKLTKIISNISQFDEKNRFLIYQTLISIVLMLSPFTPHISHILWKYLGQKEEITFFPWPKSFNMYYKEKKEFFLLIIQINGKFREKIKFKNDISFEEIYLNVLNIPKIKKYLHKKNIVKHIYVPKKLINLVTN